MSYPVSEVSSLRNATYAHNLTATLGSGNRTPLPIPSSGGGAVDIEVSFRVTAGMSGFGVSVRSGDVRVEVKSAQPAVSKPSGWLDVLVYFFAGPQPCVTPRGHPPCKTPPSTPPPTNATIQVVSDSKLTVNISMSLVLILRLTLTLVLT